MNLIIITSNCSLGNFILSFFATLVPQMENILVCSYSKKSLKYRLQLPQKHSGVLCPRTSRQEADNTQIEILDSNRGTVGQLLHIEDRKEDRRNTGDPLNTCTNPDCERYDQGLQTSQELWFGSHHQPASTTEVIAKDESKGFRMGNGGGMGR